jgi:hypothetical protein
MVEDLSAMVDIPDTKGFAVKTSAERFKQCPLPYNYRHHNRVGRQNLIAIFANRWVAATKKGAM